MMQRLFFTFLRPDEDIGPYFKEENKKPEPAQMCGLRVFIRLG